MKALTLLKTGLLALCLCVWCAQNVNAYTKPQWLFAVERPVEAQSVTERERVAREALLEMITRLTGLTTVPESPEIERALDDPTPYYDRFLFFEQPDASGRDQLYLSITFLEEQVLALVKSSGLPLWWTQRPTVVTWIAVESEAGREILSATSQHPLRRAVETRARYRGLNLIFPLMDTEDQNAVSASDVWERASEVLNAAAERYDADFVLSARVEERPGPDEQPLLDGDWQFWLDDLPLVVEVENGNPGVLAREGVDLIADPMVEQYAVADQPSQLWQFNVAGLESARPYAELMQYLASFEFIERINVVSMAEGTLTLQLASRAEPDRLMALLTEQGRLVVDDMYRGLDVQLLWRG